MALLSQAFYNLPKISSLLTLRVAVSCAHRQGRRWKATLTTMTNRLATPENEDLQKEAKDIFGSAVTSVLPASMVKNALKIEHDTLIVDDLKYPLKENVHIVGFGKAVLGMACAAEEALGNHLAGGIVSIPTGMQQTLKEANKLDMLPSPRTRLKVYEGATNNIPDTNAQEAAMAIYDLVKSLTDKDICLNLITGGGSALLPAVIPPLTLEEMAQVTRAMSRGGATIQQLNTVRKNLDLLKGGGLAAAAQPARVISLVLSDVIGNPLDLIASGPTVHDSSSPQQCLDLFKLLKVDQEIPESVINFLEDAAGRRESAEGKQQLSMGGETLPLPCNDVSNAQNVIVGSNEVLIESALNRAHELGYLTYVLSTTLCGEPSIAAETFADIAAFACLTMGNKRRRDMQRSLVEEELDLLRKGVRKETVNELLLVAEQAANQERPMCILAAGETVVKVSGNGKGGRNQEMALWAAHHLHINDGKHDLGARFQIQFLSAGTDGQDGPTDAAGAFADTETYLAAQESGLNPESFLENNDSYTFFSQFNGGQNMLKTGLTGTNVMDLQIMLIKPTSTIVRQDDF